MIWSGADLTWGRFDLLPLTAEHSFETTIITQLMIPFQKIIWQPPTSRAVYPYTFGIVSAFFRLKLHPSIKSLVSFSKIYVSTLSGTKLKHKCTNLWKLFSDCHLAINYVHIQCSIYVCSFQMPMEEVHR